MPDNPSISWPPQKINSRNLFRCSWLNSMAGLVKDEESEVI